MTNRERVLKALRNEPVDRVPVAFFHHFTEFEDWNNGLDNPDAIRRNIEGHKPALEVFVPDVIKVMNDTLMMMPLDVKNVEKVSDLHHVRDPKIVEQYAQAQIDLTNKVMEIYKGVDAPVYVTSFSATWVLRNAFTTGLPVYGAQEPLMTRFLKEDPETVREVLEVLTDDIVELNRILMTECGADGIYFSVNNQGGFFPEEIHRKYIAPSERRVLEEAKKINDVNILHICGYHGHGNDLNLYTDYPAAAFSVAVNAEGTTMGEAKKLFGGKCVIGGFAQDGVIYKGSKEELKKSTWDILDECGQVGVIIGDDCTVPNDIDDDRFNWVREACAEYAANH